MNVRTIKTRSPVRTIEARLDVGKEAEGSRVVNMVFTTDAPARMVKYSGWDYEEFNEILSMEPAHIRKGRLESGRMPLLNMHRRWDLECQIGVVQKGWLEGGKMAGDVRFSKRETVEPIFQDVKDGILGNGSVGYRVHKYEDLTEPGDKIRTLKAIDWEPVEMSLVVIGADADAGVRPDGAKAEQAEEMNECEIVIRNQSEEDAVKKTDGAAGDSPQAAAVATVDEAAIKAAAVREERERVSTITIAVKAAKLGDDVLKELIGGGKTADEARAHVIDLLAKNSEKAAITSTNVEVTRDETDTAREAATGALLARALPGRFKVDENARRFAGFSMLRMAEQFLRMRGMNTDRMSRDEIIAKGFHSTSDLPYVVLDAANKAMMKDYSEAPQTFEPLVNRVSLQDFKTKYIIRMSDAPALLEVKEGGEIKKGALSDTKESYALKTYARGLAMTRQMIINDDMDFLSKIIPGWGRQARALESDLVWAQITSNPTMTDGNALFSTAHANFTDSGAVPSTATLNTAAASIMKQTALGGTYLNLVVEHLIGPTALMATLNTLVANVAATKASDVNPFRGKNVIIEPRLDASSAVKWYAAASKNQVDIVELGTLDGAGPKIEVQEGFNILGDEMRCVFDVAAKVVDHRGLYLNDGEA